MLWSTWTPRPMPMPRFTPGAQVSFPDNLTSVSDLRSTLAPSIAFSVRKYTKAQIPPEVFIKAAPLQSCPFTKRHEPGSGGVSQDGTLALLHPWVVLHEIGVQEGVLGGAILNPLEKPVGGEVGLSRGAAGPQRSCPVAVRELDLGVCRGVQGREVTRKSAAGPGWGGARLRLGPGLTQEWSWMTSPF